MNFDWKILLSNSNFLSDLGTVVTIFSLLYAIYQSRQIAKIQLIRKRQLRQALLHSLTIMRQSYRLLKNRESFNADQLSGIEKINRIHSNSCTMICLIFNELSEIDKPYNLKKLKKYIKMSLITSKWVFEQAIIYVDELSEEEQEEVENIKKLLPEVSPDFIDGVKLRVSQTTDDRTN